MPIQPNPQPVLINGNNFDWATIKISMLNNNYVPIGITELEYSTSQLRENNYGIGNQVIRQRLWVTILMMVKYHYIKMN